MRVRCFMKVSANSSLSLRDLFPFNFDKPTVSFWYQYQTCLAESRHSFRPCKRHHPQLLNFSHSYLNIYLLFAKACKLQPHAQCFRNECVVQILLKMRWKVDDTAKKSRAKTVPHCLMNIFDAYIWILTSHGIEH